MAPFLRLCVSLLALAAGVAALSGPARLITWPAIAGLVTSAGSDTGNKLSTEFAVSCAGVCPAVDVLRWYETRIQASAARQASVSVATATVSGVRVSVRARSASAVPLPSTNESYSLTCGAREEANGTTVLCAVSAEETVGALRGLETLAHLAHAGPLPLPLSLTDAPRYPYRGLLVDSARSFLPVSSLKRMLDGMSTAKLNVLHWHLTDMESFPVVSQRYPELSAKGAFAPSLVYSASDLREVVSYAASRGIRVVPEIDMPGHSSFGKGIPNITIPECYGWLDPTNDETYVVIAAFLREIVDIFPDPYLALGGDEVSFAGAATARKSWLAAHNMTADSLLPYFWRRVVAEVLPQLNRTLYVWGNDDLHNLDPAIVPLGTVFNLFTRLNSTLRATARRGVPGILSAPYYLDQTQSYLALHSDEEYPASLAACGERAGHISDIWRCFYSASPTDGFAEDEEHLAKNTSLVLGGEACIWGEATSSFTIEAQSLTGASAVGERLWSGGAAPPNRSSEAAPRLAAHVCLMNTLGLSAAPIDPGYCLV